MDNINKKYDISFIIPCHNTGNFIKPLLLSFHALNLTNIKAEFIFVLDDCTDNTKEMIDKYMIDMDYKTIVCFEHSCGIARNLGFNLSKGEYIWFVDSDDWIIYPNALQECIPLMKEQNLNILRLKYISNYFDHWYFSMVWQYLFKREYIKDMEFDNQQPSEDVRFMEKIYSSMQAKKEQMYIYEIPTYFYNYMRPGSNMYQIIKNGKITE